MIACDVLTAKIFLVYLLNITYEGIGSFEDYLHMTEDQRRDYHLYEDENFPLLRKAISWTMMLRDSCIQTLQGPNTARLDDLLTRLFNPERLNYKKWLELCYTDNRYHFDDDNYLPLRWKAQPGAEAANAFAHACFYSLERTANVILILNPRLATSGGLLEVDNRYEDPDILRKGMLLDLLDVAIFFSKDKFVKLLLDSGIVQIVTVNSCLH